MHIQKSICAMTNFSCCRSISLHVQIMHNWQLLTIFSKTNSPNVHMGQGESIPSADWLCRHLVNIVFPVLNQLQKLAEPAGGKIMLVLKEILLLLLFNHFQRRQCQHACPTVVLPQVTSTQLEYPIQKFSMAKGHNMWLNSDIHQEYYKQQPIKQAYQKYQVLTEQFEVSIILSPHSSLSITVTDEGINTAFFRWGSPLD